MKFSGKFEQILEGTMCRFQMGGLLPGDIVKFRSNALKHDGIKSMSGQYQEMVKNAMNTDLNLRVSAIKSIRPNTSGYYEGGQGAVTDAAGDFYIDLVVEYAPGLWKDPITVPMSVLERVDTGANLAPVPDSLKRKQRTSKPEEQNTEGEQRNLPKKNTKLANTKEPKDGRSQASKPKAYKESMDEMADICEGIILNENIVGQDITEGDNVWYIDQKDGARYQAIVKKADRTGYLISIMSSEGGRNLPGQTLEVSSDEIKKQEAPELAV